MGLLAPKLASRGSFLIISPMDRLNLAKPRWTGVQAIERRRMYSIQTTATLTPNAPLFSGAEGRWHNRMGATKSSQLSHGPPP